VTKNLDIFISYAKADKAWAEWIAFTTESLGYNVSIQEWDFLPGGNFALNMDEAITNAKTTLIVMSQEYLDSEFCKAEWAAVFATDPTGFQHKLIPVRVSKCVVTGLLKQVIYVDLVETSENEAKVKLKQALLQSRLKPLAKPVFPKSVPDGRPKSFPGHRPVVEALLGGAGATAAITSHPLPRRTGPECEAAGQGGAPSGC
jgi:hypothetical protein